MSLTLGGTNPAVTFPDGTIQNTAFGAGPAFSAYFVGSQTVTSGVATKVQINTKEFDTNSNYDATTNYRFTPTVAGYYQINGCIYTTTATTNSTVWIYKNGSSFKYASFPTTNSSAFIGCVIYFNGSTDYVELYGAFTGVTPAFQTGVQYCTFSGSMIRAS